MLKPQIHMQPRAECGLTFDGERGYREIPRVETSEEYEDEDGNVKFRTIKKVVLNKYGNRILLDNDGQPLTVDKVVDCWTQDVHLETIWASQPYPLIGGSSTGTEFTGELVSMGYHPFVGVKEVRGFPMPSDTKSLAFQYAGSGTTYGVDSSFDGIPQSGCRGRRLPETLRAQVAAVCEPFKVRPVTKGPALAYWLSKSYQKSIHAYLRKIPQFNLCGSSLERSDIDFLDRRSPKKTRFAGQRSGEDQPGWVSGDYSAATDNVDIRLTRICHEVCMEQMHRQFHSGNLDVSKSELEAYDRILTSTIEPHEISYPPESGLKQELYPDSAGILQQNGQLMGSPISFPYLCLINFAVSWEAVFPYLRDHRKVPIKVNGDDILFKCYPAEYEVWKSAVRNAGFKLSVGKNFFHRRFVFINSEPWQFVDRGDGMPKFEYIPFYNQGLMSGQSKVGKVSGVPFSDFMMPTYALQPEAIAGANDRQNALAEFAHRHREHLEEVTGEGLLSQHAPVEYGGLGMSSGDKDVYTIKQRKFARVAQDDALNGRSVRRPQCMDDVQVPFFSTPVLRGPLRVDRESVGRSGPSDAIFRFFTPYAKVSSGLDELDDSGYAISRVTNVKDVVKYYHFALKSKCDVATGHGCSKRHIHRPNSIRAIPERIISRGYRVSPYPYEFPNGYWLDSQHRYFDSYDHYPIWRSYKPTRPRDDPLSWLDYGAFQLGEDGGPPDVDYDDIDLRNERNDPFGYDDRDDRMNEALDAWQGQW
jgi:hypothetical protein